jgi:hypothetical protein
VKNTTKAGYKNEVFITKKVKAKKKTFYLKKANEVSYKIKQSLILQLTSLIAVLLAKQA